jgi:ferric-chelate reductase
VPYINDHIARSSSIDDEDKIKTRIQDMQLIWVTRQQAFIHDLAARELRPALSRPDFRASFYSTLPLTSTSPSNQSQRSPMSNTSSANSAPESEIEILSGRPNLDKQILAFAYGAQSSDSSAAVLVCGPRAMADEARSAVSLAMRHGYQLSYVEESFTW